MQNFKFTLKDPPILRSSNDYTFYFGKVKVNDLIRCELNGKHWCVNESDALSAIDTGIANLNKEYDLRNFEMGKYLYCSIYTSLTTSFFFFKT